MRYVVKNGDCGWGSDGCAGLNGNLTDVLRMESPSVLMVLGHGIVRVQLRLDESCRLRWH